MSAPDVIRIRVYRDDKGWWYQPERVTNGGTGAHIDIGPRWPSPGKGAYRYCQTVERRHPSPLRDAPAGRPAGFPLPVRASDEAASA